MNNNEEIPRSYRPPGRPAAKALGATDIYGNPLSDPNSPGGRAGRTLSALTALYSADPVAAQPVDPALIARTSAEAVKARIDHLTEGGSAPWADGPAADAIAGIETTRALLTRAFTPGAVSPGRPSAAKASAVVGHPDAVELANVTKALETCDDPVEKARLSEVATRLRLKLVYDSDATKSVMFDHPPDNGPPPCQRCNGSGRVNSGNWSTSECGLCGGSGEAAKAADTGARHVSLKELDERIAAKIKRQLDDELGSEGHTRKALQDAVRSRQSAAKSLPGSGFQSLHQLIQSQRR